MKTLDGDTVSREQTITIAELDALPRYGAEWLAQLQLRVALQDDGWHVEFHQWRPRHTGGGPHYVIDATTGAIVSKRYYSNSRLGVFLSKIGTFVILIRKLQWRNLCPRCPF